MAQRFHLSRIASRGFLRTPNWLVLPLMVAVTAQSAAQEEAVIQEMEEWAEQRMPAILTGIATGIIESQSLTSGRLELAGGLLNVATEIGPDSLPAWRKQLQLATAMRDDIEGADALERDSIDAVVRLAPSDTVARLRQILLRIADRQTAEERVAAYESFLTPSAVETIGEPMAARLAFDLALLKKRTGDTNGYIGAVAKAVELDPSFPPAVSAAAGFFRMASDNIKVEVELLIAAVSADPLNGTLMRALGKLLLRHGAYTNAAEVLEMGLILSNQATALGRSIVEDNAIALWGSGESAKAIKLLDGMQRDRAAGVMKVLRNRDPFMSRHDFLENDPAPLPELALLKAVILSDSADPTEAEAFYPILERSFIFQDDLFNQDVAEAQQSGNTKSINTFLAGLASLAADEAWARLWCGLDVTTVPDLIDKALSSQMIDPGQAQVLKGWLAFREGRLEDARGILEPLAENSPYAASGLAMVEEAGGEKQAAARRFLQVYRDVPGTAIGLWCHGNLERILETRISAPEGAAELENLAARMPSSVSRIVHSPQSALAVSIAAVEKPIQYFDPLKVRVKIRNTTDLPLAIGTDCPIQPTLAIVPQVLAAATDVPAMVPLIFSSEQALRIPPNKEVEYEFDLSATILGLMLDNLALQGATIRLRCVVNYKVVQHNVTIGELGEQVTSLPIRMNGAYETGSPVDDLNRRLAAIEKLDSVNDLAQMALIGQILGMKAAWVERKEPEIKLALSRAFKKLGPMAKAWLLTQIPSDSEEFATLVDDAVEIDDIAIFAVLLSSWSNVPGDAAIVVGRQSSIPLIRQMAESTQASAEILELIKRRQFELIEEEEEGGG